MTSRNVALRTNAPTPPKASDGGVHSSWVLHKGDQTTVNLWNSSECNHASDTVPNVAAKYYKSAIHLLFVCCGFILFVGTPIAFHVVSRTILSHTFEDLTVVTPVNVGFALMFTGLVLLGTVLFAGAALRRIGSHLVDTSITAHGGRTKKTFYSGSLFLAEILVFAIVTAAILFHIIQYDRQLSSRFSTIEITTSIIGSSTLFLFLIWESMEIYWYWEHFNLWSYQSITESVFVAERSAFPILFGFGMYAWLWAWTFGLFTRAAYVPVTQNMSSFVFTNGLHYMYVSSYVMVFLGAYIGLALMNITFFHNNREADGTLLVNTNQQNEQNHQISNAKQEYMVEKKPVESSRQVATMRGGYISTVLIKEIIPMVLQGVMAALNSAYGLLSMIVLFYGDAGLDGVNINNYLRTVILSNAVLLSIYFVYLLVVMFIPCHYNASNTEDLKFEYDVPGRSGQSYRFKTTPSDSSYGPVAFTGYAAILLSFFMVVSAWASSTMYRTLADAMEQGSSWQYVQQTADHAIWSVGTMYRANALMLPVAFSTLYAVLHSLFRKGYGHQHIIVHFSENTFAWPWREWFAWGSSFVFTIGLIVTAYMALVDSVHLHGYRQWPIIVTLIVTGILVAGILSTFTLHVMDKHKTAMRVEERQTGFQLGRDRELERIRNAAESEQQMFFPVKKHMLIMSAVSMAILTGLNQALPMAEVDDTEYNNSFRQSNGILQNVALFAICFFNVLSMVFAMDNIYRRGMPDTHKQK